MQRLFLEGKITNNAELPVENDIAHYLSNVLKMKQSDPILVFNENDGEWLGEVRFENRKKVFLCIKERMTRKKVQKSNVTFAFSLLKKQNNSFVVAKATELNVAEMYPIVSDRSIVRKIDISRYDRIAREASEQCGRLSIPTIHECVSLEKLLLINAHNHVVVCSNQSSAQHINSVLGAISIHQKITILIGPEGGFSEKELLLFENSIQVTTANLGDLVLRAETAALFALTACRIISSSYL
jgi:16S rRNA (uracil1498-N3)-methyltransferase